MVYLYMQTFAIPGTLSLSILAGAIYGCYKGLLLVTGDLELYEYSWSFLAYRMPPSTPRIFCGNAQGTGHFYG
jgi:hypothetical protein